MLKMRSGWLLVFLGCCHLMCHCVSSLDADTIDQANELSEGYFDYEDAEFDMEPDYSEQAEEEISQFEDEEETTYIVDPTVKLTKGPLTDIVSEIKYSIGRKLTIGDYFLLNGRYNFGTQVLAFKILSKGKKFVLNVIIKPLEAKIVLKSKGRKAKAVVTSSIILGGEFRLTVTIMPSSFKIFFNGEHLCNYDLPENKKTSIPAAKTVQMIFDPSYVNPDQLILSKFTDDFLETEEFASEVRAMEGKIKEKVMGLGVEELKMYLNSEVGSIEVLQWVLFKQIADKEEYVSKSKPAIQWLISHRGPLEMFMTSGKIKNDKFKEALEIFEKLFREDPAIQSDPLHLRLAVATSLVFANPIRSRAVKRNNIDWMSRYWYFLDLAEEGTLMPQFTEGTAWHLRFVVGSCYTDDSLTWGRENTSQKKIKNRNIGEMGGYTYETGVTYNGTNEDGQRVSSGPGFYYYQPNTLEVTSEIGGVCGAVGNFNAGMAQAFGVPATNIGQPGHCAYTYWNGTEWRLRNTVGGGWTSTRHGLYNPGYLFHMMEEAQSNWLPDYILSEKMKYANFLVNPEDHLKILESATSTCPFNDEVWFQLLQVTEDIDKISSLQPAIQDSFKDILLRDGPDGVENSVLSRNMVILQHPVVKDQRAGSQPYRIYEGVRKGVMSNNTGRMTIEVEIRRPSLISQVILSWGEANKGEYKYKMYAKNPHEDYQLVRTSADETAYSPTKKEEVKDSLMVTLDGWALPTQYIMIETDCIAEDIVNCTITLNEMQIVGTELASLDYDVLEGKNLTVEISDDPSTTKLSDMLNLNIPLSGEDGWFEIEIGNMAVLRELDLQWKEGTKPHSVRAILRGCSEEDVIMSSNSVCTIQLNKAIGTTLRIEVSGNSPVLEGVRAMGVDYNIGEILKKKSWETVAKRARRFIDPQRLFMIVINDAQFHLKKLERRIDNYGEASF